MKGTTILSNIANTLLSLSSFRYTTNLGVMKNWIEGNTFVQNIGNIHYAKGIHMNSVYNEQRLCLTDIDTYRNVGFIQLFVPTGTLILADKKSDWFSSLRHNGCNILFQSRDTIFPRIRIDVRRYASTSYHSRIDITPEKAAQWNNLHTRALHPRATNTEPQLEKYNETTTTKSACILFLYAFFFYSLSYFFYSFSFSSIKMETKTVRHIRYISSQLFKQHAFPGSGIVSRAISKQIERWSFLTHEIMAGILRWSFYRSRGKNGKPICRIL